VGLAACVFLDKASDNQRRIDVDFVERLSTKLSSELGNVAGVMNSVSSVQQILDNPYGDQLDTFASESIEKSALIKSMARYERIVANDKDEFIQGMSESGLYDFKFFAIDKSGNKTVVNDKSVYYPVVWRQPFNPISASMLGIDLSSNNEIKNLLKSGEASNSIKIVERPVTWSFSGASDLVLFLPTYYGRYAPEAHAELGSLSNGGVVVGINLSEYISSRKVLQPGYDLSFSIESENPGDGIGSSTKYIQGERKLNRRLSGVFRGVTQTWTPIPGNETLHLTIRAHGGVGKNVLLTALMVAFATSLILAVCFFVFYLIRQRDAVHRHDRETALTTLKAIDDAVITADEDGLITYVNPSAEQLLLRNAIDIVGSPICKSVDCTATDSCKTLDGWESELIAAMDASSAVALPELQLLESSENPIYISSAVSPLGNAANDTAKGHVLVMRDVTAERKLTRELEYQATHDSLTGLASRYRFEDELERLIDSSINRGKSHAVCYIDLDQFKTINDTCGHSAGDKLLVTLARGLESQVRKQDVIARLGGDEFGLLINDCDEDDAKKIGQRIYEYFQSFYFQQDDDIFAVRASIGFVHMSGQFDNIEDVMAAADVACYTAKDHGRNELYIFERHNDETSDRMSEMLWLPKLQLALRRDSFRLFAQPIVGIKGAKAHGETFEHYEVLLRLQTESGDLITPAQLIIAAERYNLMKEIDRWVIGRAISFLSQLQASSNSKTPKLSINISGQSSTDPDLPLFIEEQISKAGVDPASLVFEITETAAITNMQSAVKLVDFLHQTGCKVALDDFGTGVCSFGYLKSIPVDYIKIDGQFVKNIDKNDVDREMVKCMQAVANILGIELVAEFVETAAIVETLRELDVDYAQGYYYSKPHPIEELLQDDSMRRAA